jgi:hypothetical protein
MEFILTSLDSSRLVDQASVSVDHRHHYHDIVLSDESRLQESFGAFTEALRQFVLGFDDDADDSYNDGARFRPFDTAIAPSTSASTHAAATAATTSSPPIFATTTANPPSSSSLTTAAWLYETCSRVPSPLPTLQLTLEVLSAAKKQIGANSSIDDDESSMMQSFLFELFGEGEQSIEALFEVMGKLDSIRKDITKSDLRCVADSRGDRNAPPPATATMPSASMTSSSTQRLEQLQQLRAEAYEAANLASALRTDLHSMTSTTTNFASRGTHSITRKSDKDAEKSYKRAIKQAMNAVNKAREAGALTEYDDTFLKEQLSITSNSNNNNDHRTIASAMEQMMLRNEEAMLYNAQQTRGIDGMTSQQIASMKHNLHPEGTRIYNDGSLRGLPAGTEREVKEGQYEKVTIPAHILDKSMLRNRIDLDEVLGKDTDERAAFVGTKSLNPMQSTVFDAAYNTRENLLICAPTGKRSLLSTFITTCPWISQATIKICTSSASSLPH